MPARAGSRPAGVNPGPGRRSVRNAGHAEWRCRWTPRPVRDFMHFVVNPKQSSGFVKKVVGNRNFLLNSPPLGPKVRARTSMLETIHPAQVLTTRDQLPRGATAAAGDTRRHALGSRRTKVGKRIRRSASTLRIHLFCHWEPPVCPSRSRITSRLKPSSA
ncbi:hypothetical protein D9M71_472710 [compost metagenome]